MKKVFTSVLSFLATCAAFGQTNADLSGNLPTDSREGYEYNFGFNEAANCMEMFNVFGSDGFYFSIDESNDVLVLDMDGTQGEFALPAQRFYEGNCDIINGYLDLTKSQDVEIRLRTDVAVEDFRLMLAFQHGEYYAIADYDAESVSLTAGSEWQTITVYGGNHAAGVIDGVALHLDQAIGWAVKASNSSGDQPQGTIEIDYIKFGDAVQNCDAPVFTSQLVNQTVCSGDNASFTVQAEGEDLNYTWFKEGKILAGQTSSTLDLVAVNYTDHEDSIQCQVTDLCGNLVKSNRVMLRVDNVDFFESPQSQTVCTGSEVTFSAMATGSNVSYQWYRDGALLGGATSSTLTMAEVDVSDEGTYKCVATADGCTGEVSAYLTVMSSIGKPSIIKDGDKLSAEGVNASTYIWFEDCEPLSEHSQTIMATDDANYKVMAVLGTCVSEISDDFENRVTANLESMRTAVTVYPNPNDGLFNISLLENAESIEVFDANGKSLLTKSVTGEGEITLDLSTYGEGVFLVTVTLSTEEVVVQKVVVE